MLGSYLRFRFLKSGFFIIKRIQQVCLQSIVTFKSFSFFCLYFIIRVFNLNLFLDELQILFIGYKYYGFSTNSFVLFNNYIEF